MRLESTPNSLASSNTRSLGSNGSPPSCHRRQAFPLEDPEDPPGEIAGPDDHDRTRGLPDRLAQGFPGTHDVTRGPGFRSQVGKLGAGSFAGVPGDQHQVGVSAPQRLFGGQISGDQLPCPLAEPEHRVQRRRDHVAFTVPICASSWAQTSSEIGCSSDRSSRLPFTALARHSLSGQR